jgi:hypothetical protein
MRLDKFILWTMRANVVLLIFLTGGFVYLGFPLVATCMALGAVAAAFAAVGFEFLMEEWRDL